MASAYYIVLEKEIDGLNTALDGKHLVRHIAWLIEAAGELGVRPLPDFFSATPERLAKFMMISGMDTTGVKLPPLRHYSAAEGLATVRAMLPHAPEPEVVADLQACERILTAAARQGVGWHLELDCLNRVP